MLSRAEAGRKRGKQESAGKLLSDSRGMHLEKPLTKPSFAGTGTTSLASGRTPPSKPKTRPTVVDDSSQKERKSLWNWKPLKALANSRNKKFKCFFSLKVHTIVGLPSRFENSSLRVHWKMRDDELSTRSSKVIERIAEFEESLTHNCVVHGRSGANHSAKYDAKLFTLFPSVVGAKHLDLGKHKVELTRLFPLTLEELEDEKSTGTWTTSFKLSGEARGAVINVSFGYTVTADSSASNGNRRVGDESGSAKQVVAKTKNVVNPGDSLLAMLTDNSHEFSKLGENVNAVVKMESPTCSELASEIELRNNDIRDFPLICSELGLEEAAISGYKSRDWTEGGVNASSEMISLSEEVNVKELNENIERSLLAENVSHDLSEMARSDDVNERTLSSFSDLVPEIEGDHEELHETVEFDEQEKHSSILGNQPHDISKEADKLDATNEVLFPPEFCVAEGNLVEFVEQEGDSSMKGYHSHGLSNLEGDESTINEISLLHFSEYLDEMEETSEKLSPACSELLSQTAEKETEFDVKSSQPTCSEVSQKTQKEGTASLSDNFPDLPKVSDVLNAINELLSATETIAVFNNPEKSEFCASENASEVEESYKAYDSANYHDGANVMNQTQSPSSPKLYSEKGLGSDRFHEERNELVFLNGQSFEEAERETMFRSIDSRGFFSEIDVMSPGFEEMKDNAFLGPSDDQPFEALPNPESVNIAHEKTFVVLPEITSVDSPNSAEQKHPLFLENDAEEVENDFLDMLGIQDTEDQPESPRECLLREFEKDCFAFLEMDSPNPQEAYDHFSVSDEFDLDSILRDMEQETQSTLPKTVDQMEPRSPTRDIVFNEESFQSPPPMACHVEDPEEVPALGEGLGSFLQTKNGGFLRSMSPAHFKNESSLIMQVSSPVVIPAELGSDANDIVKGLASIGIEKLSKQANKLMPLDDIAGKTMQQVAFEAGASQVKSSHWNDECVTLNELAPLAMEKIEALSMEGLKFQSGVSECSGDGTAGVRLLQLSDTSGEVDGLMGMSLSLDQWMRLDSGDFGNENDDVVSEETSKILAAHGANSLDSIRGKKRGKRSGLLGNTFTVSLLVQLRDPLRDFEAVGTPMLALVQVERVFAPPKPKIYFNVPSSCRKEEGTEEVERFVVSDVHIAGLENESGKEKVWGSATQQKCGSRWLLANGMGKNNKTLLPAKGPPKPNTLWTLSSKSKPNPTLSKWTTASKLPASLQNNHHSRKLR